MDMAQIIGGCSRGWPSSTRGRPPSRITEREFLLHREFAQREGDRPRSPECRESRNESVKQHRIQQLEPRDLNDEEISFSSLENIAPSHRAYRIGNDGTAGVIKSLSWL